MNRTTLWRTFVLVPVVAILLAGAGGALAAAAPDDGFWSQDQLNAQNGQYYVVQRGDTVSGIARRFGTTVQAIMTANGLRSTTIYVGQRLLIPNPSPGPGTVYIVQRGDTLIGIARRFGMTVQAIMDANGLRSTTIYVGQRLLIPGPGYPPPAQPTRIQFPAGSASARVNGNLATNGLDSYVLRALAGQTMTVNVSSSQARMLFSIHGANGEVLKSSGAGGASWSGPLPATQDYYITISAEGGVGARYLLEVIIPPLGTTPPQPTRIQFPPGGTSATVQETLATNEIETYVLKAMAGQTMTVNVWASQANTLLSIHGANGEVLKSSGAGGPSWSGVLPVTQDYFITIQTQGGAPTPYTLQVAIPPA